eukprot:SAG31_NODE_23447_length_504_cov_0.856790_1_plen_101_part_01
MLGVIKHAEELCRKAGLIDKAGLLSEAHLYVAKESELAGKRAFDEAEAKILARETQKFEKAEHLRQHQEDEWLKQRQIRKRRVEERRAKQEKQQRERQARL